NAATRIATSCSNVDVQAAVNLAASGDTVLLPNACSVTWSGSVTIPNTKGITLDGNKASVARGGLSSGTPLVSISPNSSTSTRVTGFGFTDSKASVGYFIV